MKTFNNCAAQGDLYLRRIAELPKNVVEQAAVKRQYVVAHSETGHHHVVAESPDVKYYGNPEDEMRAYLVVQGIIGAQLEHLRDFDTHETLLIPPGIFELRRQREYTPEGWRRVED